MNDISKLGRTRVTKSPCHLFGVLFCFFCLCFGPG